MKNLSQFYYSSVKSSVKYSQVPQGTPDIQRIIASNPKFWIAPTLPIILKQKSLVLADWQELPVN